MNFWEFLLWFCIAYFVYKVMTGTTVDKKKFVSVLRLGFNPPLNEILYALDKGDTEHARKKVKQLLAELNDPKLDK